jgi:hypothetical protein
MKFETVRKMEETIKGFTSLDQLKGDIQVVSQGTKLILKNMGAGKAMDLNGAFYMCEETADSFMVNYEQNGKEIKVISTNLSRV